MFPYPHLAHHVIHRMLIAFRMLIAALVVTFQFHMHQVAEVHRHDTYLEIQHQLMVEDTEQDSEDDLLLQVN